MTKRVLTAKELEARRAQVAAIAQSRRDAAYCKHGHLLQGRDVYIRLDGRRQCLVCMRANLRRYRALSRARRQMLFEATF